MENWSSTEYPRITPNEWIEVLSVPNGERRCIFAPRQSGKTTGLIREFINTPNSVYVTPSEVMGGFIKASIRHDFILPDPDYFIRRVTSTLRGRGERINTVFVDEFRSGFNLYDFMMDCYPLMESNDFRVIMVSTPRTDIDIHGMEQFANIITLPIFTASPVMRNQNHFDDDLFVV